MTSFGKPRFSSLQVTD